MPSTSSRRRSTTPGCATSARRSCRGRRRPRRQSTGCSTAGGRSPGPPGTRTRRSRAACAAELAVPVVTSPMVNEGGGHPRQRRRHRAAHPHRAARRGPQRDVVARQQVEDELRRTLGVDRFIWLERGLTRDYDEFGTRGHVDIVACFCDETHRPRSRPARPRASRPRRQRRGASRCWRRSRAARRRGPRTRHAPGRRGLGRLLLHQPLRLQRCRHPVRLRRSRRRAGGADPARCLPRTRDRAGRCAAAVRPRRGHPLHHAAAARRRAEGHVA